MPIVVKNVNEPAYKVDINGEISLEQLQQLVHGYIEEFFIYGTSIIVFINEEGLISNMDPNIAVSRFINANIVGPAVFCKTKNGDCLPLSDEEADEIIKALS